MKIVVTGATGYIGTRLIKIGVDHGHVIVAASRRPPINHADLWIPFDISACAHIALPVETAAVIHLAVNAKHVNTADAENEIESAIKLIQSTKKIGAKFIFVSSQTARLDAPTSYGRTKWRIEREVLSAGGWVVRPGQVYGGELRGLFGMLVKIVKKLPVLPAFVPAPQVQPIHVDDLAKGLLRIVERADLPSSVYCLAAPEPVSFSRFLDEIAKSRLRCWRGFVPVPVVAVNTLVRLLGTSLCTRLGLERLRSLFDLPVMATASDLELLGIALRPLAAGMHSSGNGRKRALLQEGQILFAYLLKKPAGGVLLRRYVRAIEKLRGGGALALPKLFVWWPTLLALVDGGGSTKTAWGKEFLWRLDSATILAEATPLGARRFLGLGDGHGFARSTIGIVHAIAAEVSWRIVGMLFAPVARIMLPRTLEEQQ
jgi:NADH dehydrogenase